MARQKRTSLAVEKAYARAVLLRSIDTALDLNGGLTLTAYEDKIKAVQALLDDYNIHLAELDGKLNTLQAQEKELKELSTRMLAAVAVHYGKDSNEYEQAGGTRTSEINRKPPTSSSNS